MSVGCGRPRLKTYSSQRFFDPQGCVISSRDVSGAHRWSDARRAPWSAQAHLGKSQQCSQHFPRCCRSCGFGHRVLPCASLSSTGQRGDKAAPAPSYTQVWGAHSAAVDVTRSLWIKSLSIAMDTLAWWDTEQITSQSPEMQRSRESSFYLLAQTPSSPHRCVSTNTPEMLHPFMKHLLCHWLPLELAV